MNNESIKLPDQMDRFTDEELEIISDWAETPIYLILQEKYREVRENEIARKIFKNVNLIDSSLAYVKGAIDGQRLELNFFFSLPSQAKQKLDERRAKESPSEITSQETIRTKTGLDIKMPINNLTGF